MQIQKCSNRNCGWIGTVADQREVRISDRVTELHCPRCDNNSFYEAQEGEVEKRKLGHQLITLERQRQVKIEGWTPEHDKEHAKGELADAAACYLACHFWYKVGYLPKVEDLAARDCSWPWDAEWWKPSSDPIRNLVKAGALIAAEIDRLQRLQNAEPIGSSGAVIGSPSKS